MEVSHEYAAFFSGFLDNFSLAFPEEVVGRLVFVVAVGAFRVIAVPKFVERPGRPHSTCGCVE